MAKTDAMAVVAAGAVCNLGLNLPAMYAAVRSALSNFRETFFIDQRGRRIVGAAIPPEVLDLDEEADGAISGGDRKLARMTALAFEECVRAAPLESGRAALLLVGPRRRRSAVTEDSLQHCAEACRDAFGRAFEAGSEVLRGGSPQLVTALGKARTLLDKREADAVLVVCVDSLLNGGDIKAMLRTDRLLTSTAHDGFIPGEGAACLQLRRAKDARAVAAEPLVIAGLGAGEEAQTLDDDKPSHGAGLAQAIDVALQEAALKPHQLHARYADVSAESYFFEEASYAWSRLLREESPDGYRYTTPVTKLGYAGTAMGGLLLGLLFMRHQRPSARLPNALLHLSCSAGARAAVITAAP